MENKMFSRILYVCCQSVFYIMHKERTVQTRDLSVWRHGYVAWDEGEWEWEWERPSENASEAGN